MLYKVKISHLGEKGAMVADSYIVEATSVIDAEAKVASSQIFDEYSVEAITKPRISYVVTGDGCYFYRCKASVAVISDKMTNFYDLVQADTFEEAVELFKARIGDFVHAIEFVQLTPIKGFIP